MAADSELSVNGPGAIRVFAGMPVVSEIETYAAGPIEVVLSLRTSDGGRVDVAAPIEDWEVRVESKR